MARPKVFVTRRIAQEALDVLGQHADMTVWEDFFPPPREALLAQAEACQGLLTMVTDRVDRELLDRSPDLVVVSNMATGLDNVDVVEATRHGVLVGRTPGVLDKACAEFTFALLLAATRRVVQGDQFVRQGEWKVWHPATLQGPDLHGATLGLVGLGAIGLEVAVRARAFEMEVLYYQRHRRLEEERKHGLEYAPNLDILLRRADFVSLHVPLTPETHHIIGAAELRAMQPHVILVNTSRGPVVDQRALYQALRDGAIAAAAMDVTEEEPISQDDPLLTLPNVVITPHIASAGASTRVRMALMATENLLAGLAGKPMPCCANPEAVGKRGTV